MKKPKPLTPDAPPMKTFAACAFKHADPAGYVSLRAFYDDVKRGPPFHIFAVPVSAGVDNIVDAAVSIAIKCGRAERPVVFAPPLATFTNKEHAGEKDLLQGLVLSVECDAHPVEARERLEKLLGPATIVVKSGGTWTNGSGVAEDKLHLHWLLARPATGEDHARLKLARRLAAQIAGSDHSNIPSVHPIRWPGSWHRKKEPRLCTIVSINPDIEIELDDALATLTAAAPAKEKPAPPSEKKTSSSEKKKKTSKKESSESKTDKSPSGRFYNHCARLFESGLDVAAVAAELEQNAKRHENTSAQRYISENRLREQVEACHKCWLARRGVALDDFRAYMRTHEYIFMPTGECWPAASVNARIRRVPLLRADGQPVRDNEGKPIKLKASRWLDEHRPVEQMTWAPGQPQVIADRLVTEGGWIDRPGVNTFNLYRPATLQRGDASKAGPWRDHLRELYDDDVAHIECFLAHRVQRPHEKINHALVLGGEQGIGKDTLLEPVRRAVGVWNFRDISPKDIFEPYNDFARSVILRVNEVHDLGDDVSRRAFYDRMKNYAAAPPDTLRLNEKYRPAYYVVNCCGVVMTTNHRYDGLYLPVEDRRTYVTWSDLLKADFKPSYWDKLWHWYEHEGGYGHVAAYLAKLDISGWNAKAPPPRTRAWWDIVDANRAPEDAELADVLDKLGKPDVVTIVQIVDKTERAVFGLRGWLKERKNRRAIPHRMESCGYVKVRNDAAADGMWKIDGKRQAIYARNNLLPSLQIQAARRLTDGQ